MTSLWSAPVTDRQPAEPLDGDTTADVVVVGAGLTGLWAAYYLLEADAALDVLVLDAGVAGGGAATTGIGACSADLGPTTARLAQAYGTDAARELRAAVRDAVVEVGGALALEEVDCGFTFGGAVHVARNEGQAERLAAMVADAEAWGDEWHVLGPDEVAEHVTIPDVVAGAWTPDCAVLDPGRLVAGLVAVLQSRGVRFAERTTALGVSPRAVRTDRGIVRAPRVVVAVEATEPGVATGPGLAAVPTRGLATAPLGADVWAGIGLDRGVLVADLGHLPVRARRTDDDRLVLTMTGERREPLDAALAALYPAADTSGALAWSGCLGVARDGLAHIGLEAGIATAAGLGASGVAWSNLAGRTLADLVTDDESPLTRLPWVGHQAPAWRMLGGPAVSVALRAAVWADAAEQSGHEPRSARRVLDRVPLG